MRLLVLCQEVVYLFQGNFRGSVRLCGRAPGVLPVCGVQARGSVRHRGRAQLVRGVLVCCSPRPRGRGLAFNEARYQLSVFVTSP